MPRNTSRRLKIIKPGSPARPTIVCVLPEPVAPYAKTVAFTPESTPRTSGFAVPSYTSSLLASPSNAPSKTYRRSRLRTPPATTFDFRDSRDSSGSITTMHRSSTVLVIVRAPARRSFFDSGRARTATDSVAWLTPLLLSTDVNFTEASTSARTSSCFAKKNGCVAEDDWKRDGGQSACREVASRASSVPKRARPQKLRMRDRYVGRRGRRFPAAPGTTSTRARSRTELDTVETRETRHVLSRLSDRGTSSERLREAAMRRCGYRPRACVSARVRSSLASREKRFRASEALPAYLVVRRHVAGDSYPRSDRRISLGSADRRREGSCSRRNAARFSTGARVRDAAARETGGDERVSRVRRVPVRVVLVAPGAPRARKKRHEKYFCDAANR